MNVSEFKHGTPRHFTLEPSEIGAFSVLPEVGAEVLLHATDDGLLLVGWSGLTSPEWARCRNPRDGEALIGALDRGADYFAHVLQVESRSRKQFIRLELRFFRAVRVDPLKLAVDEKIRDQLAKELSNPALTMDQACQYLTRDFLFPVPEGMPAGMGLLGGIRCILASSRAREEWQRSRFRLLGGRHAIEVIDLKDGSNADFVDKLIINPKTVNGSAAEPLFSFHGDLQFIDASVRSKVINSHKGELDTLVNASDSYFSLWRDFQELETKKRRQKSMDVGSMPYSSRTFDQISRTWVFQLDIQDDVESSLDSWESLASDATIEASSAPPDWNLLFPQSEREPRESGRSPRERNKNFRGQLRRIDTNRNVVHVAPPESQQSQTGNPAEKGYIFVSVQGDITSINRRLQALDRLSDPDKGIPALAQLIEGRPVPSRRLRATEPLSARARQCFRGSMPTEKQKEAIRIALNTPDIAIIQGPPGTGKTRTIAAIVQRINELDDGRGDGGKPFLLTSFQHDAVETVANATSLMGLPAVKFGRKQGRHDQSSSRDAISYWIENFVSELEAANSDAGPMPVSTVLARIKELHFAYRKSPTPPGSTSSMLREVATMVAGILPPEIGSKLRQLAQELQGSTLPAQTQKETLQRLVAGLRTTSAAFSDDGPKSAYLLSRSLDAGVLTAEQMDILARAAAWDLDSDEDPDFLPALHKIQSRLQELLIEPEIERLADLFNQSVVVLLDEVLNWLEKIKAESPVEGPRAAIEAFIEDLRQDPNGSRKTIETYSALLAATCQQAASQQVLDVLNQHSLHFQTVVVDEAARANPLDLMIPMSLASQRVILVGDHRQLPHLLEPDVEKELSASAGEVTKEAIRKSLFEKLFNHVRELETQDGVKRCITLDRQYRMHPVLADLVNEAFYMPHGESFGSPNDAEFLAGFEHGLTGSETGKLAVWIPVRNHLGSEIRPGHGHSWLRPIEARIVAKEALRLLIEAPHLSIGIITFYSAQVTAIMKELGDLGIAGRSDETDGFEITPNYVNFPPGIESRFGDKERLRVGTVDAFQGKEFDVVILSPVRSNDLVIQPGHLTAEAINRRKFGHLMLSNRMCVALSRQRRLIIVVGDPDMFNVGFPETMDAEQIANHPVPGIPELWKLCNGPYGLVKAAP
jgi:hypothetical protein